MARVGSSKAVAAVLARPWPCSLLYGEPWPTALIEAAACGRAALASRVEGVAEVVEHGRTGLLVPPGNPAALAEAVSSMLVDPQRRAEMGWRARRLAEQRFDMCYWARTLAGLYERAVGRTPMRYDVLAEAGRRLRLESRAASCGQLSLAGTDQEPREVAA